MSPDNNLSYMRVDDLSTDGTLRIFSRAQEIQKAILSGDPLSQTLAQKQIALVFSEASTRTKMSFQMAAQRLGAQCLVVDHIKSSSMSKGETFEDTFWTLHSIRPDLFVVRCGHDEPLLELAQTSEVPIVNGGFGSRSHPTQALLDAFSFHEHFGRVQDLKVLLVGDIAHSRVAHSNFSLLHSLGAEVAICAPEHMRGELPSFVQVFDKLEEAAVWCDVYMGLRIQFERHQNSDHKNDDSQIRSYTLDKNILNQLSDSAVIAHPGPVNWGVEFQPEVQKDPRLLMWKQKQNGVFVRAALMEKILGGSQ